MRIRVFLTPTDKKGLIEPAHIDWEENEPDYVRVCCDKSFMADLDDISKAIRILYNVRHIEGSK